MMATQAAVETVYYSYFSAVATYAQNYDFGSEH